MARGGRHVAPTRPVHRLFCAFVVATPRSERVRVLSRPRACPPPIGRRVRRRPDSRYPSLNATLCSESMKTRCRLATKPVRIRSGPRFAGSFVGSARRRASTEIDVAMTPVFRALGGEGGWRTKPIEGSRRKSVGPWSQGLVWTEVIALQGNLPPHPLSHKSPRFGQPAPVAGGVPLRRGHLRVCPDVPSEGPDGLRPRVSCARMDVERGGEAGTARRAQSGSGPLRASSPCPRSPPACAPRKAPVFTATMVTPDRRRGGSIAAIRTAGGFSP